MSKKPPQPSGVHGGRSAACGVLLFTICASVIGLPASSEAAPRGENAVTCTNSSSGAAWQLKIDYDRGTVDSDPARISDSQISWHARADGGNYTLDRKTGDLKVVLASSTGGSFLYHRCKLEP